MTEAHSIVVADPPWRYGFSRSRSRKIENQYQTMDLDQICRFLVEMEGIEIAKSAVLYLWATAPKLQQALLVMSAWGFDYKTGMVWDKKIDGMGYWTRGRHEHILIGTKGGFSPPAPPFRVSSVIEARRGRHSKKPDDLQDHIDAAWPMEKKLEVFGRRPRDGWTVIGNEL